MTDLHKSHYPPLVFFGTPHFAAWILEFILGKNIPVSGVVTAPDKPAGRGRKLISPAVKQTALKYGLPILQPPNLKDPSFLSDLKALNPVLQVVVAFRMLPESVWSLPRLGTFNLHASLLPQYRGAAPIQWALINGEKVTGVTTFFISHQIDTGKIILSNEVPVDPEDDAGTLSDKLMKSGAELVVQTIDTIVSGKLTLTDQNGLVTGPLKKAPRISREDTIINWHKSPEEICNLVRAMSPAPGATTTLEITNGKKHSLKILKAVPRIEDHHYPVPVFVTDKKTYLDVAVRSGFVRILKLQLEGKKPLPIGEFLKGFRPENVKIVNK